MKHLYKLSLLLLALLLPATATAYHDFVVDGIYYGYNLNNVNEVYIASSPSSNRYSGNVVIPSTVTYNGTTYSVTSIGQYAFRECRGLTSIYIPNSVTAIGNSAFEYCSGLTSVNITDLEAWLSITFDVSYDNLCANPLSCAHHLYLNGTEVKNLIIPSTITWIREGALVGCSGLRSVTIPNSVTAIGNSAFYNCSSMTSIDIPNSVTSIGNYAFTGCSGLTSITIGNSVSTIGSYAFIGCDGLTSITIPNSVTSIGDYAFNNCSGLTSVDASDSQIATIGNSTFYNCRNLSSVSLPYSLTSIKRDAFYWCEKLDQIVCKAITPPIINEYNCIYPGYYMATLYVPKRSVEAYRATEYWSNFLNIVGFEADDDIPHNSPQQKCDTNDDGEINISDVNRVIDAILGH